MSEEMFTYWGEELHYFDHMYNLTTLNERRVEMSIASHWLSQRETNGLEIGNVTGHYQERRHMVVDMTESPAWYQQLIGQPYLNLDLFEGVGKWKAPWVLSLSTIEHTVEPLAALMALKTFVHPAGSLLVTFPTGVSTELDLFVQAGFPDFTRGCTFARLRLDEFAWAQTLQPEVHDYGPWANCVAVVEWEAPA